MAIPVYSTRFLLETASTGLVDFVVPVGFAAVVRCFDCVTPPTSGCNIILYINGAPYFIRQLGLELQFSYTPWRGRQAAIEGDVLQADTTDVSSFCLSGYLLSLP